MSVEDKELGYTRFKCLTDEEVTEAEMKIADAEKARIKDKALEKKARQVKHENTHKMTLLNAQTEPKKMEAFEGDGVEEISTGGAELPPTIDDTTKIGSKTNVREAMKGLINDMKVFEKVTHTALLGTPKAESQRILEVTKAAAMEENIDDQREFAPRPPKLEKHVSFRDQAPYKTKPSVVKFDISSLSGANDEVVSHDLMDRNMVAAKPGISFEMAAHKKLAPHGGKRFQRPLKGVVAEPAMSPGTSPFVFGTMQKSGLGSTSDAKLFDKEAKMKGLLLDFADDGATDKNAYLSCPPERMERLPSVVAKTLHQGKPEVKLSKDEKAAILQTTVLSSPIKEGSDGASVLSAEEGVSIAWEENRKINAVLFDN